jgi:hypothetical protein
MRYFINYQHLLERMEMKTKAKLTEKTVCPSEDIYLLDGDRLVKFLPETMYLESTKTDTKTKN